MSSQVLERAPEHTIDTAKRRQILDGARRVFFAEGFDGASMGEIAKAAGVSKGTLYVYFTSKEALFEALILEERTGLAEVVFSLDESDPDVRSVLHRLGVSFLQAMVQPDHISSVRMVIGAADKFPRFGRTFYEAGPLTGASRLKSYLDQQVAAGRLRIEDTALAAEQFLGLCSVRVFKRAIFAVPGDAGAAAISREVDSALTVFFAAYGIHADHSSRKAAATRA
jgi:AcrR family transcriptional regulator